MLFRSNWYGVRIFFLPTHQASSLKTRVCRQRMASRMLSDWRTATSLFRSKQEVPRNRYAGSRLTIRPRCDLYRRRRLKQGHAKGTSLPTVGPIEVSWHVPGPGPSKPPPSDHAAPAEIGGGTTSGGSALADKGALEEEAVASGWGDDGEDGMGML